MGICMKIDNIELREGEICLRLMEEKDKEAYYDAAFLNGDEEAMYFTGTKERFERDTVYAFIQKIIPDESRYDFIINNSHNEIIGEAVIHEIEEEERSAGFRICLFRSVDFSKGYGSIAIRLILKFAFETLKLHRVELEVFDYNHRGQRAYEKAGFVVEGTKRDGLYLNGTFHDIIMMAILEEEYFKKYGSVS
ncbi:hypothetical protein acsn021_16420 [Anaerocolumna cellulosilytica]|uniref:Uncharacterized protein n=1 Tax=Anaerocolumna cellulosilytica TaxID=433286 RepID=A0A6S6QRU8_9FIRM|nr:GNAT family protein [Anaerocolumna cellulosilytica]MBB5197265.1 RimJ/RimL family protein N-acetyltransferase [Anaerocolumna cellulosilytica]BCJ94073.1 hypothetical protein acsn021_16420 [Anaerocolumna cellulosilytica]